jgi:hypothetical protein
MRAVRPDLALLWPSYTFFPLIGLGILAVESLGSAVSPEYAAPQTRWSSSSDTHHPSGVHRDVGGALELETQFGCSMRLQ